MKTLESRIARLERFLAKNESFANQDPAALNGATLGEILANYAGLVRTDDRKRVLSALERSDVYWLIGADNDMDEDEARSWVLKNWIRPCRVRKIAQDEAMITCNGVSFSLQFIV
jgi:hypothetical protein